MPSTAAVIRSDDAGLKARFRFRDLRRKLGEVEGVILLHTTSNAHLKG